MTTYICPEPAMMEKKVCDAERILNQLTEMVTQANELVEYANTRLSQITPQEQPCKETGAPTPSSQMSPLFSEYRIRLNDIGAAMVRVRRMLERIEV